jgi:hypothetical protein
MGLIPGIRYLFINDNYLEGPVPAWVCNWPLNLLWLGPNNWNGTLPACFGNVSTLEQIVLDGRDGQLHTSLSGPLPEFRTQTNLRQFYIRNQRFDDPLPSWISGHSMLSDLRIDCPPSYPRGGELPQPFEGLPSLEYFTARYCNYTGSLDFAVTIQNSLYLDLTSNRISGMLDCAGSSTSRPAKSE